MSRVTYPIPKGCVSAINVAMRLLGRRQICSQPGLASSSNQITTGLILGTSRAIAIQQISALVLLRSILVRYSVR